MSSAVYSRGRQYNSVAELQPALLEVWEQIPHDYFLFLVATILKWCLEVIEHKGKKS